MCTCRIYYLGTFFRLSSQSNCNNVSDVSAAPQRPKCQNHNHTDYKFFAVSRALAGSGRTARMYEHQISNVNVRGAQHHGGGAIKMYNSPSLIFWTNQYQQDKSFWTAGGSRVHLLVFGLVSSGVSLRDCRMLRFQESSSCHDIAMLARNNGVSLKAHTQ